MEHWLNLKTKLTLAQALTDHLFNFNHPPSIRRRVFAKLPREVVLEYANYYGIPNPKRLASNQICDVLYSRASEVQPLERHVQYPTWTGVVVAQTPEDLVGWLAQYQSMDLDADLSDEDSDYNVPFSRVRSSHKTIKMHLFDALVDLLAGFVGVELANLIADILSSLRRKFVYMRRPRRSLKRRQGQEDDEEEEALHRRKRARLWNSDTNSEDGSVNGQEVLWADYVCDDSSDSSYAPSTGTSEDDDARMTPEEIAEAREYELWYWMDHGDISGDLSSESEPDVDSGNEMRWKDYPSEASDTEDSDYVPPNWNFEDVLEIASEGPVTSPYFVELDSLRHMNALVESGRMSDAGVSVSNADSGSNTSGHFHHLSTTQRTFGLYDVPTHLEGYSTEPSQLRISRDNLDDSMIDLGDTQTELSAPDAFVTIEKVEESSADSESGGREGLDTDAALDFILSDNNQYAFDDREWQAFEDLTIPRTLSTTTQ